MPRTSISSDDALQPHGQGQGLDLAAAVHAGLIAADSPRIELALLDAAGAPFTPSEQPISGLEWADALVAPFQLRSHRPAGQVLRIARRSDLTADRATARHS